MTDAVKKQLDYITVESVLVPGGCTKYIQAPDVSWNKPLKAHVTEQFDEWLTNRIHEYTAGGKMKPAPRRRVVEWILNSWKSMPVELNAKLFRSCTLTLPNDGQEDDQISCFKPGRTCEAGREILNQQMKLLTIVTRQIKDRSTHFPEILLTLIWRIQMRKPISLRVMKKWRKYSLYFFYSCFI